MRYGVGVSPEMLGVFRTGARGVLAAAALAAFSVAAAEEPAPPPTLTLENAIAIALESNRLVATASLEVGKAADEVAEIRSQRFPTLSLKVLGSELLTPFAFTFEKGVFGTYPGIGPVPAEDTKIETPQRFTLVGSAQLAQPLSQQYKIGLGVKAKKAAEEAAREDLRARRHSVVSDVREAYYGLLQAESALRAASEGLASAREVERVFADRLATGSVLEVDHMEARARRAQGESQELNARNALAVRREQLNLLLARPIATDFRAVPVPPPRLTDSDLEAARQRALERRPEVKKARLQATQAEYDWKLQRAEWIPDLSLSLNYVRLENFDTLIPKNFVSFGLYLSWDVFDWGRRNRQSAEKEKTHQQAALAVTETEQSTLVEVGRLHRKVAETLRSYEAAELNRQATRERLRVDKDRFEAEKISASDLMRSQSQLADADRQFADAVAAFWTARADLERAVGEDP